MAHPDHDFPAQRETLLQRDAEWAAAASEGRDVDRIVSYWAEDATVIPPGQPALEGREAIRAYVTASLATPGFRIHWTSDRVEFSRDGQLAYMRSANEVTVAGPAGLITLRGRAVTVWRRDRDGEWRCVLDIWNDAPAEAAADE